MGLGGGCPPQGSSEVVGRPIIGEPVQCIEDLPFARQVEPARRLHAGSSPGDVDAVDQDSGRREAAFDLLDVGLDAGAGQD